MRTSTIIRRYFSQKNKVAMQNFFEINPIYPSAGEKDATIFKEKKPTIKPLEHSFHLIRNRFKANDYIEARIKAATREPSERDKKVTEKIILEAETRLPLGMGFNWYIQKLKGRSGKNFSLRYVEIITDLIRKFELRNEPQLVRFFRLAIADSKSNDIIKQIKGNILQNIIKESVKRKGEKENKKLNKKAEQPTETIQIPEEEKEALLKASKEEMNIRLDKKSLEEDRRREFYAALKEIDEHIAQAEANLKIHERQSFRHDLYDTNYNLPNKIETQHYKNVDVANDVVRKLVTGHTQSLSGEGKTQDYLIEQRIKRLYFLKKLEFAQKSGGAEEDHNPKDVANEYLINVGQFEFEIADLASKYNLLDIVPNTEIDYFYNVLDLFLSQLNLNVKDNMSLGELKEKMKETLVDPADYLWESIRVDKIFEADFHRQEILEVAEQQKHNLDTQVQMESCVETTPSELVETTLNNTPFNVYQHNDLGIFGKISENRSLLDVKDILGNYEIDPKDTFRKFIFELPKERIPPPPKKWAPPTGDVYDWGKRKSGTALCRIRPGTGIVNINRMNIRHYFPDPYERGDALKPALMTGMAGKIDVDFFIQGSGTHSQAAACCTALTRALYKAYPRFKKLLRRAGLVTIDPRFKERKHSGRYKARKGYVYVRR